MAEGHGLPIREDPNAESADPGLPAFIARPPDAPVDHGFPILEDVDVEGFRLGMITDLEAEPSEYGDAFVIAPDGSRAGLVWEIGPEQAVAEVLPPTADRWGVWHVAFPNPMTSREDARENLASALPELRRKWQTWLTQPPPAT